MLTPIYPDYARACGDANAAATDLVEALEKALTLYPAKLGDGERAALHTALRAARTAAFVCAVNDDWGGDWPEVLTDEQIAAEAREARLTELAEWDEQRIIMRGSLTAAELDAVEARHEIHDSRTAATR